MTEKPVVKRKNRPDMTPRDEGVLLRDTRQSGWRTKPRRDVSKPEGVSEHNFADQHHRFFDPGDDAA